MLTLLIRNGGTKIFDADMVKISIVVNGCDELRINGAIGRRQRKEAVNGLQGWSDATFMGSERWIAWGLVELIDGGGL